MTTEDMIATILTHVSAIDTTMQLVLEKLEARAAAPKSPGYPVAPVADAAELDSKFGDVEVRKNPPRWSGESFVGKRFSECSIEFLEAMASFCDWKAGKDAEKGTADGDKYATYARKDAARARGWIARKEGGWKAPEPKSDLFSGDDAPF
jgi:hypothetical protein